MNSGQQTEGVPVDPVELAQAAVGQMFFACKANMTDLEIELWRREIDNHGPEVVTKFVLFWTCGGGQGNFMRAPRIDDFRRRMDPSFVSLEDALLILRREVSRVGPYADPAISDPGLKTAILEMGGWAKVCQDMPDASLDFEMRRFSDRFKSAWVQGESAVLRGQVPNQLLLGLVSAPKQLSLYPSYEQADDAEALPGPSTSS